MSMNAQLIESIRSLVSDVASNEDEMLALRSENQSLKERLLSAESENVALHTEIEGKNKSLHALSIELNHLNKQRLEYIDNVRQHFMVQADLMELKYEIEILNSKIRNLDRDLVVQKSENERLRRLKQNFNSEQARK